MVIALSRPSPGQITSGFGNRAGGLHEGIDFGWGNGWTIYAAASGVVRWAAPGAGYGARYGNLTIIDHGGFETRYAHQTQMWVRDGYKVSAGEGIGLIGGSGERGLNTYAPHLHFELLVGGKRVNPALYLAAPAGGEVTPIPDTVKDDEIEDDMEPKIIGHKNEEVAVLAPWLHKGRITSKLGTPLAIGLSRLYSPTKDSLVPMYDRDAYLGMIAAAEALAAGYQAALPKAGPAVGGASKADIDAAADRVIDAIPTEFTAKASG